MDLERLDLVNLPVLDYLWLIHHEIVIPWKVENNTGTVEAILQLMTEHRVHRVWLTENHHFKGVVTLTDLCFNFLDLKSLWE